MTAQPEHETWTSPTWMVQAVFDPDEPWRDFAYTIGLGEKGCPSCTSDVSRVSARTPHRSGG